MTRKLPLLLIIELLLFAAANGQSQWKEFRPAGQQFSVQVPCDIKSTANDVGTATNPQVQRYYDCPADDTYYIITVFDVVKDATDEMLVSLVQKSVVGGFEGKVISETAIKLGTVSGRKVTARAWLDEGGDTLLECRIFVFGKKVYSATIAASPDRSMVKDKFLSSFKFTN